MRQTATLALTGEAEVRHPCFSNWPKHKQQLTRNTRLWSQLSHQHLPTDYLPFTYQSIIYHVPINHLSSTYHLPIIYLPIYLHLSIYLPIRYLLIIYLLILTKLVLTSAWTSCPSESPELAVSAEGKLTSVKGKRSMMKPG